MVEYCSLCHPKASPLDQPAERPKKGAVEDDLSSFHCDTYANLFMAHFEEKHIYAHNSRPRIWFRFIDDIWGIFNGDEISFKKFNSEINSVHASIKLSGEFSKIEVDFLNVTTYRKNSKVYSRLLCKPTDSHSYLEYNSCHPPLTTRNPFHILNS